MRHLADLSDHELMAGVERGDIASLDALFTRHHARLFSFLARWTGDDHAAEDLVQETFLRLLRRPERYPRDGIFLAWLYRVARNLAVDRYRHEQREAPLDADSGLADDSPLALDRLTAEERQRQLDAVLTELPLAHREIALVLECSEGAARVRLHRATAALRQLWHQRYGGDA